MSHFNREIQEALETQVLEQSAEGGVEEVQLRNKRIKKASQRSSLRDMLLIQGINSPKRGFSVGRHAEPR